MSMLSSIVLSPVKDGRYVLYTDHLAVVAEARNILRTLEWSAKYSSCTGWPCCPICNGIKTGHGRNRLGELPDNQGHFKSCKLAKALVEEDSYVMEFGMQD